MTRASGTSIFGSLWRLLDTRQRGALLGLQLLSIIMALSTVGGVAAVLPFFAALSDSNAIRGNGPARALLHWLNLSEASTVPALGAAFAASVLIANAINLFGLLAINRFSVRVGEALYGELFAEYLHRGYEFHARSGSSVLASRVQEGARVTAGIVQYSLILVSSLVTIAFIVVTMACIDPLVAVGALTTLGASYAAIYAAARRRLLHNGQCEHQLRSERMRTVGEGFAAIKDVTLWGAHDFFAARFARQSRRISSIGVSTFAVWQSPKYVLECLTVICLVVIALYAHGHEAANGSWVSHLTFVGFAAYRLLPALQQAFSAIVNIRTDRAAFSGVEVDLHRPRAPRMHARAPALDPAWRGRPQREVRLCNVSYRYSPDRAPAVNDVSLVIPAGAIVGFKGANGSGKTTLLDLVSGLLLPHSGHVEVDGMPLRHSNRRSWQTSIAYVSQHAFLQEATLAENVAFGVPPVQIDRRRLEAAVRMACLSDCVASFPAGYDERLGQTGRDLSGGERQRVAIARALYRDAALLIFDEATSSLDSTGETNIGEMLRLLQNHRTILIVAHRANALRHCEVVYEMSAGRIAGTRSHAQRTSGQAGHG